MSRSLACGWGRTSIAGVVHLTQLATVFEFLSTAGSNPTSRDIVQAGDGAVAFERPGGGCSATGSTYRG